MEINHKLLCNNCKLARKSGGRVIKCMGIGDPVLVLRYGNKCRRFQPKKLLRAPELCPRCIYFQELPDWDACLIDDLKNEDVTCDCNGVILTCCHFKQNPYSRTLFDD